MRILPAPNPQRQKAISDEMVRLYSEASRLRDEVAGMFVGKLVRVDELHRIGNPFKVDYVRIAGQRLFLEGYRLTATGETHKRNRESARFDAPGIVLLEKDNV